MRLDILVQTAIRTSNVELVYKPYEFRLDGTKTGFRSVEMEVGHNQLYTGVAARLIAIGQESAEQYPRTRCFVRYETFFHELFLENEERVHVTDPLLLELRKYDPRRKSTNALMSEREAAFRGLLQEMKDKGYLKIDTEETVGRDGTTDFRVDKITIIPKGEYISLELKAKKELSEQQTNAIHNKKISSSTDSLLTGISLEDIKTLKQEPRYGPKRNNF